MIGAGIFCHAEVLLSIVLKVVDIKPNVLFYDGVGSFHLYLCLEWKVIYNCRSTSHQSVRLLQNTNVTCEPWLESMLSGSLCLHLICRVNRSMSPIVSMSSLQSSRCRILDSLFTATQIALYLFDQRSPMTKSMEILFNFCSRIGSVFRSPYSAWICVWDQRCI